MKKNDERFLLYVPLYCANCWLLGAKIMLNVLHLLDTLDKSVLKRINVNVFTHQHKVNTFQSNVTQWNIKDIMLNNGR